MVGVPETSFDFWAAKVNLFSYFVSKLLHTKLIHSLNQFVAQGYKVGRVEQCETALGAEMRLKDGKAAGQKTPAKSIVRRELKSVLTAGTLVDGSMLTDDLASHCVSIKVRINFSLVLFLTSTLIPPFVRNSLPLLLPLLLLEFVFLMLRQLNSLSHISKMILVEHNSKLLFVNSNPRRLFTKRRIFPYRLYESYEMLSPSIVNGLL